jgi:DinB superfamily
MSAQAKELAQRLSAFNEEVVRIVETAAASEWVAECATEQWPFGVVARHIAAAHYQAVDMAGMILKGEALPNVTMEQLAERGNAHAREHADCTPAEVLALLRTNGERLVQFTENLTDVDLTRTGHLPLLGREVNAAKLLEIVVLGSAGEHLASLKTVVAG